MGSEYFKNCTFKYAKMIIKILEVVIMVRLLGILVS